MVLYIVNARILQILRNFISPRRYLMYPELLSLAALVDPDEGTVVSHVVEQGGHICCVPGVKGVYQDVEGWYWDVEGVYKTVEGLYWDIKEVSVVSQDVERV